MSNSSLRTPPETEPATPAASVDAPKAQEENAAILRLIEQFEAWRDLNPDNDQVAQTFLDQAYEYHHGYGLEREIENLELTIEESLQCRQISVATHERIITAPNILERLTHFPQLSVDAKTGVRACHVLTLKRRQLDQARERALLDAASRLDRLLKKGVAPSQALTLPHPLDRPTLSWRIQESGSAQRYILGIKGVLEDARRTVRHYTELHRKQKGEPGFGLPPSGATGKAGVAKGPPASGATSTVR